MNQDHPQPPLTEKENLRRLRADAISRLSDALLDTYRHIIQSGCDSVAVGTYTVQKDLSIVDDEGKVIYSPGTQRGEPQG